MGKTFSLTICGDIVATASNIELFIGCDLDKLIGVDLKKRLSMADLVIANLEAPLTLATDSILKCGEPIRSDPRVANCIGSIGKVAVSLANNHIMDYGYRGLRDTLDQLDKSQIKYFGAGRNLEHASRALKIDLGFGSLSVISFAEHEFSIAEKNKPGANPYDPLMSFDEVRRLKEENSYLIVLYHGGKEYYRYPSPDLQRICRKFIDCGANLVVCQHSHCIGCEELYSDGRIVYGQGNFIFDAGNDEFWSTSLILEVDMGESNFEVSYIPVVKKRETVRMPFQEEADKILDAFKARSREIMNGDFIDKHYESFAKEYLNSYLKDFVPGGNSLLFRVLNKLIKRGIPGACMSRQQMVNVLNRIECEAHRELFVAGLKASVRFDMGRNNDR